MTTDPTASRLLAFAPPAARPAAEPPSVDGHFLFGPVQGRVISVTAEIHFAPDGSFRLEPYRFVYDESYATTETVYLAPIVSGPNATARQLIEALAAAAGQR